MMSELTTIEEQLHVQAGADTKLNRWIIAERRKMDNYDPEIVRTCDKINQLTEEKR